MKSVYICVLKRSQLILRFVDRDMLMRYHFGLGVGHIYSHSAYTKVLPVINETSGHTAPAPNPAESVASCSSYREAEGVEDYPEDDGSEPEDDEDIEGEEDEPESEEDFNGEEELDWDEDLIAEEMYEE